jgi:RHS repeat-associated protein
MTTAATCAFGQVSRSPSYYRGEQYDPDLGLYYLRARYYNPLSGRFMSRDPDDQSLRSPNELHKYLYSAGDPVNASDPTGRGAVIGYVRGLINSVVQYEVTKKEECLFFTALSGFLWYDSTYVHGTAADLVNSFAGLSAVLAGVACTY